MKKNPERARELLIWIQDTIATGELRDPVCRSAGRRNTRPFDKFLKLYRITPKILRK